MVITVIDIPETPRQPRPNRRVVGGTCTKHGGTVELDPHVTGQCVIKLAEDECPQCCRAKGHPVARLLCPQAEACPGCGDTTGVQRTTGTSPDVNAFSCMSCQMQWAITTVNPAPPLYADRLAATVEQLDAARSTLRQVCALADRASTITDQQLRAGLLVLASCASVSRCPMCAGGAR